MIARDRFDEVKHRFGAAGLLELAEAEGLHHRGSGRNRCECPGCRNGDPRGASIGEKNGVGLWHCFRDESHRGTAIDFLALARSVDVRQALDELVQREGLGHHDVHHDAHLHRVASPAPCYPPASEVADVWARALPLGAAQDVADAWQARGLDVAAIEERDLARALRFGVRLPRWAWGAGSSWSEGAHRLVVPMFDAGDRLVTLHARAVRAPDGKPKGLSPAGHSIRGAVMADACARELLAAPPKHVDVLVAEGVPDFLTWTTHWNENAPAVFGIIAGSWTEALAAGVPAGARVLIATHTDEAGEKYARQIAGTLRGRCRALRRHPEPA